MSERESSTTHVARAVVLAALAVGVSTVAHALAGGHTAGGRPLVLTLGLLVGLALPLVRRARTVPGAAGLLALLQVVGHAAHEIAVWCQLSGAARLLPPAGHPHRNLRLTPSPGASTAHTPAGMETGLAALVPSLPMLLAHLVVAVGLAWTLTNAERSWAVAGRLALALGRPVRRLLALVHHLNTASDRAPLPHRATMRTARLPWMLRDVWLRPGPVRRGPPLPLLG